MAYNGHNWVNDGPPAINAANLNEMDEELVYLDEENSNNKSVLKDDYSLINSVINFLTSRTIVFQPEVTNQFVDSSGNITDSPGMRLTKFIKIPENKRMYASFGNFAGGANATLRVAYYSSASDSNFIGRANARGNINDTNRTDILVNASNINNAEYVRLCYEKNLTGIAVMEESTVILSAGDNLDNIIKPGVYGYLSGNAPTNFPISFNKTIAAYGYIQVFSDLTNLQSAKVIQIVLDYYNNFFVRRRDSSGTWTDWTQYATNNDTQPRALDVINDVNDITEDGVYHTTTPIANNWPISHDRTSALYGMLYHINISSTISLQIVSDYGSNFYIRRKSSGTWTDWTQYAKYASENYGSVIPLSAKVFKRVGCVGDSYTAGYIRIGSDPAVVKPEYSWPHFMETLTGNTWTNFGISGSSCKSWVNGGNYSRLAEVQAEGNKCQAYIIGLMINDSDTTSPNYVAVGTSEDIGTDADSYYAYYYKLIQAIHAVNTDAPIFCNTCPKTASRYTAYNQAVRDIVAYCQNNSLPVYLCDLAGSDYNNASFFKNGVFTSDLTNGHYTGIGYEMMAECLIRVISDVMVANNSTLKNIHEIKFDEVV